MATRREEVPGTVALLLWGGLGAMAVGLVVAMAAWPRIDLADGGESGSWVVAAIGLVVAGVGQVAVLVAAIAYGVRFGVTMTTEDLTPTPAPRKPAKSLSDLPPLRDLPSSPDR